MHVVYSRLHDFYTKQFIEEHFRLWQRNHAGLGQGLADVAGRLDNGLNRSLPIGICPRSAGPET